MKIIRKSKSVRQNIKEEHPTGFIKISMQVNLKSSNVTSEELVKAIDMIKNMLLNSFCF